LIGPYVLLSQARCLLLSAPMCWLYRLTLSELGLVTIVFTCSSLRQMPAPACGGEGERRRGQGCPTSAHYCRRWADVQADAKITWTVQFVTSTVDNADFL